MTSIRKIRTTLDTQGRPVQEVADELGQFAPVVDEDRVRSLGGDKLGLAAPGIAHHPDFNPYGGSSVGSPIKQRSKLDYMRALSREIQRRNQLSIK